MEMEDFCQDILSAPYSTAIWDQDPDWPLDGLLDKEFTGLLANDVAGPLLEDESFWSNCEGIPLKEVLLDSSEKSPDIDDLSNRDENPLADYFDVRVDLIEFEKLIQNPDFDSVMHSLDETISIFDEMETFSGAEQDSPATEKFNGTDVAEVPDNPVKYEESSTSISEASPSFFVEVTTSPPGSPGNELIGQPQQYVDVILVDADSTINANDLNDSSSNLELPSCSTKVQSLKKTRASQRNARKTPYSRSNTSNSDDGGTESSSSFDESQGCSVRGPKERKRVQNRCAATRYRMKKRTEQSELDKEEAELAAKNKELTQKADQLFSEIGYLKGLMRDMLISKGLIEKK